MTKDEINKRIAEWFKDDTNIDYYSDEGFCHLIRLLESERYGVSLMNYSDGSTVMISAWNRSHAGPIVCGKGNDLQTALVEAVLSLIKMQLQQPTGEENV